MHTDCIDGPPAWDDAECVVEQPAAVEDGRGEPGDGLDLLLEGPEAGTVRVVGLLIQIVLPETEHRYKAGSGWREPGEPGFCQLYIIIRRWVEESE